MVNKKKIERIAYHEAGHALINLLLELPFVEVSIENSQKNGYEYSNGQKSSIIMLFTKGITWSEDRKNSVNKNVINGVMDLREALSSMAGPQAEAIFIGKIDKEAQLGAENDIQFIIACCRAAIAPGVPIKDWNVTVMESHIIQAVASEVHELLTRNWTSVETVANALIKRKKITYKEVQSLIIKKY